MSDILLWTLTHRRASAGQPARTNPKQLCMDQGCSLEDLPGAMDDWDEWRERARKMLAVQLDYDDIYIYCDGKSTKIPKRDFIFCTCEDGAGWHLIPYRISTRSEFFSQAYKNWHIM